MSSAAPKIVARSFSKHAFAALLSRDVHPVLARVYAARGIEEPLQLKSELASLMPADKLKNVSQMAQILADGIAAKKRLLIIADYDADGATACAVGVRALREFGACVDFLVPNRFEYGYGLTPEIVQLAARTKHPDILITVDNGIAAVEGVAEASRLGMTTLITDHHLPGTELPQAACIVNPNQHGCGFPSKNLAGVGVIFYVMLALRAELRARHAFDGRAEPHLSRLLDVVALGTLADVVRLDHNNRILVGQGLKRMREGKANAGIQALFRAAGRDPLRASTYDLAFMLGPRLNAAGRLDDMTLGIDCLLSDDPLFAATAARKLDQLNRERRDIEADMKQEALAALERVEARDSVSMCLFDPSWHPGVVGLLASRIKDKFHRPVIAFAPAGNDELKGSGRAIPALHLRDTLDLVAKRHPGLILKFGGHAAAAGLTIRRNDFEIFSQAFEETAAALVSAADLERVIETDGALDAADMQIELARLLEKEVWGQGFPQPTFCSEFTVENQRIVGEKHLKLKLALPGRAFDAMLFFENTPLPQRILAVYRLAVNEYNGVQSLQLNLEHWQARA
ncbi:MAG TPA: single-stranded-DNA-specific exonuclease RecJ [Burkholderiales bacterium]|nr:single-stranded-DNA-specific exonuclease RecJ [Burkholderiales bacterium]